MSTTSVSGYAGDVTVQQAFEMVSKQPDAVLVDVRSQPEWTFVGLPDLSGSGKRSVCIEWQVYPGMSPNADFLGQLAVAVPDKEATVLFLCRSGARSRAAAIAATGAGFARAFNIAGGFEGDLDDTGRRGRKNGWKSAGLPWRQS